MKKAIAIALLAMAIPAFSAPVAMMRNAAGGYITLTDTPCPGDTAYLAYGTTASSNRTLLGCWTATEARVFIVWDFGKITSYPIGQFTPVRSNQ